MDKINCESVQKNRTGVLLKMEIFFNHLTTEFKFIRR
jgi:hypothetical protein